MTETLQNPGSAGEPLEWLLEMPWAIPGVPRSPPGVPPGVSPGSPRGPPGVSPGSPPGSAPRVPPEHSLGSPRSRPGGSPEVPPEAVLGPRYRDAPRGWPRCRRRGAAGLSWSRFALPGVAPGLQIGLQFGTSPGSFSSPRGRRSARAPWGPPRGPTRGLAGMIFRPFQAPMAALEGQDSQRWRAVSGRRRGADVQTVRRGRGAARANGAARAQAGMLCVTRHSPGKSCRCTLGAAHAFFFEK